MKPLLIILTLAATLLPATEAMARESNRKAKVPSCEAPKCCLHSRVPRVRAGVRAEAAPRATPAPPEQTWQERMASKGSGG